MSLSAEELFGDILICSNRPQAAFPDAPVVTDSRSVASGTVFVAISGSRFNGNDFIGEVVCKNPSAIVFSGVCNVNIPEEILCCQVTDARKALSLLCRHRSGCPDKKMQIYGVTGTNGKTTSAYLIRHILEAAEIPCGLVSTVEFCNGKESLPPTHTTPDPQTFYPLLQSMLANNVNAAAMELSSHALAQNRLAGLSLRGAVFTNLTGDHLDFHGDMENYYQAKKQLFTDYLSPGAVAAVNSDDAYGRRLMQELAVERPDLKLPTFGMGENSGWRISDISGDADSSTFILSNAQQAYQAHFPLPGKFNVYNLAGVLTMLLCSNIPPAAVDRALNTPLTVPGRMEKITAPNGSRFFVDYAHTDDALANALRTLKAIAPGQLIAVFGAGGDRDKSKRPRMGAAAAEFADKLIITSDNPRTEPPLEIIAEIVAGVPENCHYEVVCDRREALQKAVAIARAEDIVLVAGKGHENYQDINGVKTHFDDREILRSLFGEPL